MIYMAGRAAGGALLDVAAERFGAAGNDRTPCLGLAAGERLLGEIGCVRKMSASSIRPGVPTG
jgi:hypothetical protein